MKKIFLSLVVILNLIQPVVCFSQQSKTDSLKTLLKRDKEDTSKVNHLNAIGWELKSNNPDTAIILSNQALSLAEKSGWKKGMANSNGQLGVYNFYKGTYPKALDYYLKALKLDEELNNKSGIGKRLSNIGSVYKDQADYPK